MHLDEQSKRIFNGRPLLLSLLPSPFIFGMHCTLECLRSACAGDKHTLLAAHPSNMADTCTSLETTYSTLLQPKHKMGGVKKMWGQSGSSNNAERRYNPHRIFIDKYVDSFRNLTLLVKRADAPPLSYPLSIFFSYTDDDEKKSYPVMFLLWEELIRTA